MMDVILMIVGIIALLLAVGVLGNSTPRTRGSSIGAATIMSLVAGLCMAGAFTYTLKANEIGLEISRGRLGQATGPGGNPNGILGTYTKAPWTSVEKFSSLPYTADPIDVQLRTRDGGEFAARFQARFHTDAAHMRTLYQQAGRTSDEKEIASRIVNALLPAVASDVAKTVPTNSRVDDTGRTVEVGVANLSTLTFAKQVRDAVAPMLEAKGVLIDDIMISGDFALSDQMRAKLADFASAKTRTDIALQDEQTAKAEARAAQARAAGAGSVPTLTPQQLAYACAQLWAQEARRATERGVPLYTSPCSANGTDVLVGAK